MNWEKFQDNVYSLVERQNQLKVEHKQYALSYAENILNAIDEGYRMGLDTRTSVRSQLLYVISNLTGAPREDLEELCSLANEVDIDLSGVIREIL